MSPIRPLYSDQITRFIMSDGPASRTFLGVYPKEKLPPLHTFPSSFVGNTHHSSRPGEHWVAFYFDKHGHGEYFDSFGLPPVYEEWENHLENYSHDKEWFYMSKTVQDLTSDACGYYAISYIMLRSRGKRPQDILNLFSHNLKSNDDLVLRYVNQ